MKLPYRIKKIQILLVNSLAKITAALGFSYGLANRATRLRLQQRPIKTIAFVCKGNICRSPYAEEKLRQLLEQTDLNTYTVISAGTHTTAGKPANKTAQTVAGQRKINLLSHRTTSLDSQFLKNADLILAMEPSHIKHIAKIEKSALARTYLLGTFGVSTGHPLILEDPYGRSEKTFEKCFDDIDAALASLMSLLTPISKEHK